MHHVCCSTIFQTFFNRISEDFIHFHVDKQCGNSQVRLTKKQLNHSIRGLGSSMPKHRLASNQHILVFPAPNSGVVPSESIHSSESEVIVSKSAISVSVPPSATAVQSGLAKCEVVISGTYRKAFEALRYLYEQFRDLGCTVLSPSNVTVVREEDGFVYMRGEETYSPEWIENRHLNAIQEANFVWLHAPEGYVGPTAALEVGFAHAIGVPVYAQNVPNDATLQSFVRVVESPSGAISSRPQHPEPPAPALNAFQQYYRRAAIERGYTKEGAKDCLILMVEEVGELARALRKREKLSRHGSFGSSNEAEELADVFLYVIHLANILNLDLSSIVQKKEIMNIEKFLGR